MCGKPTYPKYFRPEARSLNILEHKGKETYIIEIRKYDYCFDKEEVSRTRTYDAYSGLRSLTVYKPRCFFRAMKYNIILEHRKKASSLLEFPPNVKSNPYPNYFQRKPVL
jgi:hypothetical protein